MTVSTVKKGKSVTVSATELALIPDGDRKFDEDILINWISGTFQYTSQPYTENPSPVLDSTYETVSAAATRLVKVSGNDTVRLAGSGVVSITW